MGSSIQLLDPSTLQTTDVTAPVYWRTPFDSLATVTDLVEFTVLDIEPSGSRKGKLTLADAQVALSGAFRSSGIHEDDGMMDYESSTLANQIFHTRTHLGAILQPGDTVMGYHISHANYNSDAFAELPSERIPDIILVKKSYPNRRKKSKSRNWQLRSIAMEAGEDGDTGKGRGVVGRMGGRDQKKVEEDYELFLRDLEEDPEMRGAVNLYKAQQHQGDVKMNGEKAEGGLDGGKTRKKTSSAMDVDDGEKAKEDGDNEEADFPEIKLDELLENFDEMTLDNVDVDQEV